MNFLHSPALLFCVIILNNLEESDASVNKLTSTRWESQLEHISSDGDIRPVALNPAYRHWPQEKPLGHIELNTTREGPQGRIIGGREAKPGEVPYQISIYLRGFGLWCGGSIYNKKTIITAGHCFYRDNVLQKKDRFVFVAGDFHLHERESREMQRLASEVIIHPNYDTVNGIFDIALVILKIPLRYTFNVQPLPPGNPMEDGEALVSGWGYTRTRSRGGTFSAHLFPDTLQLTKIKIFKRSTCAQLYSSISRNLMTLAEHPNYVCAGEIKGGIDACAGDSGGPLACVGATGARSLCGVISSGIGCGLPSTPGFYMNLTVFLDWIEGHAGKPDRPKRTGFDF